MKDGIALAGKKQAGYVIGLTMLIKLINNISGKRGFHLERYMKQGLNPEKQNITIHKLRFLLISKQIELIS
ncbi:hypothetical protein [Rahnella contaminans]|uniref:hypothetical protein n=1 Tax=Rahnella contaminans TaxID=2703882 RepID=UPI003C2E2487